VPAPEERLAREPNRSSHPGATYGQHHTAQPRPGGPDYREFYTPEFLNQQLGQPAYWQGEGAQHLGLRNPVEASVLRHLLAGLTPDGTQPLVANQAQPERESGWCLTCRSRPA